MKKANSAGIENNIYNELLIAQFISLYPKCPTMLALLYHVKSFLNLSNKSKIGLKNYSMLSV